jgi:hypothetical protein
MVARRYAARGCFGSTGERHGQPARAWRLVKGTKCTGKDRVPRREMIYQARNAERGSGAGSGQLLLPLVGRLSGL